MRPNILFALLYIFLSSFSFDHAQEFPYYLYDGCVPQDIFSDHYQRHKVHQADFEMRPVDQYKPQAITNVFQNNIQINMPQSFEITWNPGPDPEQYPNIYNQHYVQASQQPKEESWGIFEPIKWARDAYRAKQRQKERERQECLQEGAIRKEKAAKYLSDWHAELTLKHATLKEIYQEEGYNRTLAMYYNNLEQDTLHTPKDCDEYHSHAYKRLKAFKDYRDNRKFLSKNYIISAEIIACMQKNKLHIKSFLHCHGNVLQQQLHQEIIDLITDAADIEALCRELNVESPFSCAVVEGADLAREYNKCGDILHSYAIVDMCHWLNEAECLILAKHANCSPKLTQDNIKNTVNTTNIILNVDPNFVIEGRNLIVKTFQRADTFSQLKAAQNIPGLNSLTQRCDRFKAKVSNIISQQAQPFITTSKKLDIEHVDKQELEFPKKQRNKVEARRAQILQKRKDALSRYNRACDSVQKETYILLDTAQQLLIQHGMTVADYITFVGKEIQQVLHQEFIDIIHETADWPHTRSLQDDCESVTPTVLQFVDTGQLANRAGHMSNAFTCADFCWGLLDCAKYLTKVSCKVAIAGFKGALKGGAHVFFKIMQPIRTASDVADEIAYLIARNVQHLNFAYDKRQETFKKIKEHIDQEQHEFEAGLITQADIIHRAYENIKHDCSHTVEHVCNALKVIWQNITEDNIIYGSEKIAEMGAEGFLTGKLISTFGSLFKNGSAALTQLIKNGQGAHNFFDLPLNGGTLQASIAYETYLGAAAEQVAAVGAAAEAVADGAAVVAPPLLLMSNGGPGDSTSSNSVSGSGSTVTKSQLDILEATHKFSDAELKHLRNKHDGMCTHNGHPVEFPYEHIWEGEIQIFGGKGFGGLHHDFGGALRKQGLVRNIKMYDGGFYDAEVFHNGEWIKTSFFPENWTHDEIMQCVIDIVNKKTIFNTNSRFTIFQDIVVKNSAKDISVRVVIENATGRCKTFYPALWS